MAQYNIKGECGIRRAKTAEPIELPFGTVSGMDVRKTVLDWRAHWRHLASTVERLCAATMSGFATRDGACLQLTARRMEIVGRFSPNNQTKVHK